MISVILPVRDGAATLEGAVRSVLTGQGVDLELICVDDGSVDATPELLAAWARADRRVRVLRRPSEGIVAALNTGLQAARAPLIGRMDADDEMSPGRLAAQLSALGEDPTLAFCCYQGPIEFYSGTGDLTGLTATGVFTNDLINGREYSLDVIFR